MLPKTQRLNSGEVTDVMSRGQSIFSDFFLVKFCQNPKGGLKISAIAPKKTFITAVDRNKARRRINGALTPLLKKKLIKNSFLVAIVGNKKILNEKIPLISASLEQVFIKSGIL
jgi:ribonuclease P protein component